MAKAKAAFGGHDSYGTIIKVALSEGGKWFSHHLEKTHRGSQWTKWAEESEIEYAKVQFSQVDQNYGDRIELSQDQWEKQIKWGFNILKKYEETPRFRLPN